MPLEATVQISPEHRDLYDAEEMLSVEAAWRAGLDPSAQWVVKSVETRLHQRVETVHITVRRVVS